MKHALTLILVATVAAAGPTGAAAQGRNPFPIPPGRVVKPQPGGSLTLPSTASPRAIIAQYLRQQGTDEATQGSDEGRHHGVVRDAGAVSAVEQEDAAGSGDVPGPASLQRLAKHLLSLTHERVRQP